MIRQKIKRLFSDKLVKNIGWLTGSQIFIRAFRLLLIVILARKLTTEDYGVIAILTTITDFAVVFIHKGGISHKLIQSSDDELETLANTSYWVNWILCGIIFLAQCLLAFPVAAFYGNEKLILPIIVTAFAYLLNPFYAVQDAMLRRENKLKISAIASAVSASSAQVLIIVLALSGVGLWSVVLGRVLSNFSWLIIYRRSHRWRPSQPFTLHRWKDIFNFSKFPLGIEILNHLRSNIDYLLIGRFFSFEQLGLYYFAFNAGLGVSLSAINMVANSVYPYLCDARGNLAKLKKNYRKSLKIVAAIMFPLVLTQSSLAPFYVPVVFGEKWIPAIPILIMICLSGLPRPFGLVSEQLLIAVDKGMAGLKWNVFFTAVFVVAILCAAQFNVFVVAATVLGVHMLLLPIFSVLAARLVFSDQRKVASPL
ncbi:MAG: lipopolysaccharide biosynthesis protein [Cyanobacteria bacterium J06623_5]